ncbi:MAG: hypothetical protein AB1629_06120 [Candidatus Omnitrophota bacterium]
MKKIADLLIGLAVIAIIVGIVSRAIFQPVFNLQARAYLGFAETALLLAIALMLREKEAK